MSLAVVEKRQTRRPSGCAGIFFYLLDWNRRLAKKKLFSKKLLPPARTVKKPTKKFSGEERMPGAKIMLIANENRGGFPSVGKEFAGESSGNVMRVPGLVARLMGLESMPVISHEKPRKALDSERCCEHDSNGEYSRLDQDLCNEFSGPAKLDSFRPQKLQKTGEFLNAARFNPDVLRRSVSTCSRRQQNKLSSPAKSPRLLSRSNQARLIQAAAKILEPGLQRQSRSRCAISCDGGLESENIKLEPAITLKRSTEPQNGSFIGSCRSCDGTIDMVALNASLSSNFSNASSLNCGVAGIKLDSHGKDHNLMEMQHDISTDLVNCKPPQEINPKAASKKKSSRKAELPMNRNNTVHGSKLCSRRRQIDDDGNEFMASKQFAGAKKNLNSSPPLKSTSKASSSNGERINRNAWEKNVACKRRLSSNSQTNTGSTSNLIFMKQRGAQSDLIHRKEVGLRHGQTIYRNRVKNEPQKRVNNETLTSRDAGIVSFTFSSPLKHNSQFSLKESTSAKCGDRMEQTGTTSRSKMKVLNVNKVDLPCSRGKSGLRGDELSNLLEKKIRELDSLDQSEFGNSDASARSTASILEELISALTGGESLAQIHNDGEKKASTQKEDFINDFTMLSKKSVNANRKIDINQDFQVGLNPCITPSVISDIDHPSPISIFDASFSSESCSIVSFNGSFDMKESKIRAGFPHKCDKPESLNFDSDLLDSATSFELIMRHDNEKAILTSFSNEAIAKAKFFLETIVFFDSDSTLRNSVNSFLFNVFTSISDAFFMRMMHSSTFSEANDIHHLNDLLFDFLIESLESSFDHFCMCRYSKWSKLSMMLTKNRLSKEIYDEMGRLMEMPGKLLVDLAEKELRSSNVRWTECEAEVSLMGVDFETAILQELVDEMVMDICVISKNMDCNFI